LDFTTPAGRDYTVLSPALKQPFFIGDGLTSSGAVQRVIAPAGATRLFLGTMDNYEWNNNEGSFDVTVSSEVATVLVASIRVSQVEICWPSQANHNYVVQYATSLAANFWNDLGPPITGTGSQQCVQDAVSPDGQHRFYRVVEN